MRYHLNGDFASLDSNGDANTAGLTASYPIIRSQMLNLYWNTNVENRNNDDKIADTLIHSKNVKAANTSLAGISQDAWKGGGFNTFGATIFYGKVDLKQADDLTSDQQTAQTQGKYTKLTWNASREQRITQTVSLRAAISGQFARQNLDGSEKFSLGGPSGVRAYPGGEASGDEGWLFNLELKKTLTEQIQLMTFFDAGKILQHYQTWTGWQTNGAPNSYYLKGVGIGATWAYKSFQASLTVAWRLGQNPAALTDGDDSNGTKRIPQVWLMAKKTF